MLLTFVRTHRTLAGCVLGVFALAILTGATFQANLRSLVDCVGAGKAVQWTASTGNFSCATVGGSGTVTASGPPSAGQAAQWTSATDVTGVAITGTGSYVKATSPALVTPALGTPTSGVATNLTGTAAGLTAGAATALAANGTNCSAGSFPLGVDASGAAESCTALPTTVTGTANEITASGATGAITLSLPATIDLSGKTSLKLPIAAGAAPTVSGLIAYDSTSNTFEAGINGVNKTVAFLDSNITGNAASATALAANGANCSAGSFPLGVDASGAVESCTALPTTIAGTANQITASAATGAIVLSIPTSPTLPGTTTGTFSGSLAGNATTATALAADGTNCSAGSYPLGVDASGNAEGCTVEAPTTAQVVSVTRPNQGLTNSAAADADFTSIYTIPANKLVAGKVLRIVLRYTNTAGGTPATQLYYLKLGATKVYISHAAFTPTASVTRNYAVEFLLFGTAAAGASVLVDVAAIRAVAISAAPENTVASQTLATNGTLTIVPGLTWGSNSNLDTLTLVNAMVEELN